MKLIKNDDGSSTFIAAKKGMNTFLRLIFQDDFSTVYKPSMFGRKGKAKFKTVEAAKKAYDKLSNDEHILSLGYGFKLKDNVVIGEITKIYIERLI